MTATAEVAPLDDAHHSSTSDVAAAVGVDPIAGLDGAEVASHLRFGCYELRSEPPPSLLQRLLDTVSLSGGQWLVVLGLSLITPAFVGVDRAIQIRKLRPGIEVPAPMPPTRLEATP